MVTSYAQRLEDIVLLRALNGIKKGFYIDLGANDPIVDSVTKLFYERGWSGINVEPSPHWFTKLEADRPRDVNLKLAVAEQTGSLEFHDILDTGLSTASNIYAERHVSAGFRRTTYTVETETLSALCERYVRGPIHFLKIDVEGGEEGALRGMDFRTWRPWIVLVEATEPNSEVPAYADWDPILIENDYRFVLFDGLNRFYLANEKKKLKKFFAHPADDYIRASVVREGERLNSEIARLTKPPKRSAARPKARPPKEV